jgi:hypothetical protein
MKHKGGLLLALLCATTLLSGAASAQESRDHAPRRPTRVPVTLALVDSLPDPAGFRILRRVDADPADVILLDTNADVAALSAAVEQLLLIRQVQGDTAESTAVMRVRRTQDRPGRGPRVLPWAGRVVNDLHRAPLRDVSGVGNVPSVVIWLPAQWRESRPAP